MSTIYPGQPTSAGPASAERCESRLLAFISAHPLLPALLLLVIATAVRMAGTVDSDVAWQLWTARHLNGGATLYRDIVEVNPPLWFWVGRPMDALASLMGTRVEPVLIGAIALLTAASLAATSRIIGREPSLRKAVFLAYAVLILFVMPWLHAGQREQLLLIGALPYATLVAARRNSAPVSPVLAFLIGAGAALAFALKHYFLIVPALLELWLIATQRRQCRVMRPEVISILVVGILYAAAILLFAFDYLTTIVPMARLAYGVTGATLLTQLIRPGLLVGLLTLFVIAMHRRHLSGGAAQVGAALTIAALGFAAIYFMQAKGWVYHAIPLEGGAALALAALVLLPVQSPTSLRLIAPALLALPLVVTAQEVAHDPGPERDLLRAISGLKDGDSVGFLTEDTAPPFSVTLQHSFRSASRYNGFWLLRAIASNEARPLPDPRLTGIGREAIHHVTTDFRCIAPHRIVIARPQPGTWNAQSIDILPYFQREAGFTELLTHYRRLDLPRSTYEAYERVSEPQRPPVSACRQGF